MCSGWELTSFGYLAIEDSFSIVIFLMEDLGNLIYFFIFLGMDEEEGDFHLIFFPNPIIKM